MTETLVYLHGFASGPGSRKARIFAERCAALGVRVTVPDLAEGDFRGLTITKQLQAVERAAGGTQVILVGSSLGGYLAALYAARHPEVRKVVLMAPAFGFARRWAESLGEARLRDWQRTGAMEVMHYASGQMAEIGWGLMEDGRRYEEEPRVEQPALIFHGSNDVVVPLQCSESFAARRPNVTLRVLDSDHELGDVVETIWEESRKFLGI
jgi:pimeloyl-ACP methyl ester carboxylesterase